MSPFGTNTSGFQSGRPGADYDNFPHTSGSFRHKMRHSFFASGRRIVGAKCIIIFVQTIQTITHADTRPDLVFFSGFNFCHNVRIGHVRTCHADHVKQIFPQRVSCRCYFVNAGGMKNRQFKFTFYGSGKFQIRSRRYAHARQNQ